MPSRLRAYKASDFQVLAHPTRIAVVEIPRDSELSACTPQEKLGLDPANLSQHLAILRRQVVLTRKEGNQVFYSCAIPCWWKGSTS
jgi:DNA-binding transcriptional ArsR family regulator